MIIEEQESALVTRATQRDHDAFTQLYQMYFDRIYRYIRLKLGNAVDAEDTTSAVFCNAWRTIHNFSPQRESSFAAWLFRLAHNAVVDRFRSMRDVISLDATGERLAIRAIHPGPEAQIERKLTIYELSTALDLLTEEQREVVLLRFVEGLSAREVGDIMGKQEGAVRGMQFRAIESLRRVMIQRRDAID
ncbi:MAG TPA: sigma-70 family RNA polymerase sigma factor [Ktedonobacterales bacterium]|nr:sigma-70 family RNA polymerase sigma factor [Ktedonobacterales bacterium]